MQTLPQPTSIVHGNADNKAILCFDAPSPSDAPNGYSPGSSAVPSSVDDVNKKISALARELSNLARMSILHPSRGMIRPLITTFVSDLAVEWPIGYIISFAPCTDTVSPGALQVSTALIDDASVAKKGPQRHLEGMEGASLAVTE